MRYFPLLSCVLIGLTISTAPGAEKKIEGTVASVDGENSTLTLNTKTAGKDQTEALDVLKKAKVTVNGQAATLKDVRKGQRVAVVYNPDLEVATKIDATGEGVPEPELVVLKELPNSDGSTSAPWLSDDGLTLYWKSRAAEEKQPWIWTATRSTEDDLFTDPRKLVPGNDPTVTSDGLELILLDQQNLWVCTRSSVDGAFQRPQKIQDLSKLGFLGAPAISGDGLTLIADHIDFKASKIEQVQFKRASRKAKWGSKQLLKFTGQQDAKLRFASVSTDGKLAFCSFEVISGDPNQAALVVFRKNEDGVFAAPKVVEVGGDIIRGKFPRYVAATHELFFARYREALQSDELVVIRNFDPDTVNKPVSEFLPGKSVGKDEDANRKTLRELNGEWQTIATEANGKVTSREDLKQINRRIIIKGDSFTMSRVQNGMAGTYQGKFTIDAKTRSFDWSGKGPRGANVDLRGIYALDGDSLKLCYKYVQGPNTTRPTQFKTDDKAGTAFVFLTLKRDRD